MGRIRILQVIEHLNVGGREKMFVELVHGLDKALFDPMVVTFMGGRLEENLKRQGIRCVKADGQCRWTRTIQLMRLMREAKIELVHTHMFSAGTWGRIAAFLAAVPARVHTHASLTFMEKRRKRLLPETALTGLTDKVVCVSQAVKDHLCATMGMWTHKMVVIPNGIDADRFNFSDTHFNSKPSVVAVGRLEKVKGFDLLIKALSLLRERGIDLQCTISGDGSQMSNLKELSKRLNVAEHVHFIGYVSNVLSVLQTADLFVAPSYREGLSNAILEAMACGLPVVASRVGGNEEVLKDSGWLVPAGDEHALANALLDALQNPRKAWKAARLSRIKILEEYTISKMIEKHEALYLELCGK